MKPLHEPRKVNRVVKSQVKLIAMRGNKALRIDVVREAKTGTQYHVMSYVQRPDSPLQWNERQRMKHCLRAVSSL